MESGQVAAKPNRALAALERGKQAMGIAQPTPAAPIIPPVIQSKPAEAVAVPTEVPNEYEINPQPKSVEPKKEMEIDVPVEEVDQFLNANEKGLTEQTGFKNIRTRLKNVSAELKTKTSELETLRKKVTDFESGLAVPEVTAAQLSRIEELEKYEKLYNLKATPAYRKKFVEPIESEKAKLQTLAKDYGVGEDVLNAAFRAESVADTNKILSQHFGDDVGALEAKSIIKNIKSIQNAAFEAEKEPLQTFARLEEESTRIMEEQRARANESIVYMSKDAWSDSLVHLREDKRFPELSYREGDTEHNEKFVRPILTKAGQEFGKIVKTLAQHGLTEMPKELGVAIARMTQLSHQAGVLAHQREQLANRVAELEGLLHLKNGVNRPGVNSTAGGGSIMQAPAGQRGVGLVNAARNTLNRVMNK
jgi:hypothetical protein